MILKRIGKQTYYCKCSRMHIKIPILNIAMDDPKEDRKTDILLLMYLVAYKNPNFKYSYG